MKSSSTFFLFQFFLGLIFGLLPAGIALAAYEKYAPGDEVTISEFVYNDDYTPSTGACTLAVTDPNGDAFSLPGGATMDQDDATGRHYKSFTPDSVEGVWPAQISCGTAGVDLAKLDKTFVVGYVNASSTAISNSVWSNTNRTLTSFGSLVSDAASAVWSSVARTLTSRQIGAGAEYIAGVTSGFTVTQVASSAEVDSLEADVTTIKNNVATLITEIGTSQISAIKTKTDSINWSDVTGIVTTSGDIKTKTDTIDWTNVTDIKTKTDTIAWGDVTGIKLKTDTIDWTDVTTAKANVATLITEVGTGNISAIKTKTDTIAWGDITGIVTATGAIQAKTDTIDWTNVTGIKTKTDTINWSDVTAIKTNTDNIDWTDIATVTSNIATIISEIGTGRIAAIKTNTDTIDWSDVTGIVTSNGQIKAKTDTIDWTNVTDIKTKTDTINWANVTGIKTKTDTIDWTDIATVKANVATLITEVGTGNISAIKTKTDTITWGDITGIVTATGAIQTKTDTIDWTNVTGIKTKTDTISWTDVTGIKTKTDTIDWTDIATVKANAATLITEVGTGNISAIKTKTDTIAWGDITGIVTATGAIQAKTDTIDWTNVTGIKTKTDTISWTDVTGIKTKTDTIDWTDIATVKANAATLITEVGTGNISAIKTKTDTIDWDDITGIVTATGAIQAKTDTIDWTNVTGIKTKTDTISWTDVTGIKTKTDTIDWTNITAIKSAQEAGWTVSMSNVDRVQASKTYRAKVYLTNYQSVPTNGFAAPTITLYDTDRNVIVSAASMTNLSDGVYEYTYVVSSGATQGLWESSVSAQVESGKTIQTNDYWTVEGSPAQVLINSITDDSIPSIEANVTITNEGLTGYEYQYEWCVVSSPTNTCGGGDDVYYASAAKFINAGEDFNTSLSATVSSAGSYYFKLLVHFGSETSGASRSFTAIDTTPQSCGNNICSAGESCSSCPSDCGACAPSGGGGGGGGGGGTVPPPVTPPPVCEGADFNHDKKVNSIDFSILLSFWKTAWPFKNSCVDVNTDKQVNSVDFSILMYQWGSKK